MRPSTRHLYPAWLRPGTARNSAAADAGHAPQADRAWRLWEQLRDFDRRYAPFVDIALAVVLFVVCSGWTFTDHAGHPNLLFVAALTFPLVFRRRAPEAVFAVIALVAFVQWLVSGPALADVSLLVAMYTVAVESDWIFVVIAAAILEAGVIMATVRWSVTSNNLKTFVFLTGLAIASLLAGVVVRALRSQLDWLAERAARLEIERDQQASLAAAAERARIAREMHDVVSHNIQVMVTLADAAAAARATDPERAAGAMREVSSTGRQALTDMRRMLGVLRHEPGVHSPRAENEPDPIRRDALAPQPGLGDLDALVDRVRGTGLTVSIERAGRPFDVSGAAGLTVYRIVQEALTNALKHAEDPASVEVCLDFEDPDISVRVRDDGRTPAGAARTGTNGNNGQRPAEANGSGGGHGVAGMTERAAAFGGRLSAGPAPSGGWEVLATLRDCKAPAVP
ncbi:MAG TPA: histidine kinase [Acidimicrobiales bacterium]|jgi:signal transduction histidine kinase|nr:histidine kinase [Acidimicrobiales bacterium]